MVIAKGVYRDLVPSRKAIREYPKGLLLATAPRLLNEDGEVGKLGAHIVSVHEVQPRDENGGLNDSVGRAVEAGERPQVVGRDDARVKPQAFARVINRRHLELVRSAGCGQDETVDTRCSPHLRLTRLTDHDASKEQDIVTHMKHAGPRAEEMGRRLTRWKRPEHERANLSGREIVLINARAHGGQMGPARGRHGGNETFEDHADLMIK